MLYRQPPVRSPIVASKLPRAALQAVAAGEDPRLELHARLLRRYHADGGILCGSGTHALHLALTTVRRRRPRLPVLLPAYTCYEVATAAVGADTPVALYDLDPTTLEPDWDSVRRAGRAGASALVVASLYGMPLDWDAARRTANELQAPLIEDAAQAHGASWNGRPVGSAGDLTVLSFGRGKGWTGFGGGALLWRGPLSQAAATRRRGLAGQPHRPAAEACTALAAGVQWVLGRPRCYGVPAALPFLRLGETVYHEPSPVAVMRRASARILLDSEEQASGEAHHRRATARAYVGWLSAGAGRHFGLVAGCTNDDAGVLRLPVRLDGGWTSLPHPDGARMGAAPGYPATLRSLQALRPLLVDPGADFPGAEQLARELITLPTHSFTRDHERWRLAQLVLSAAPMLHARNTVRGVPVQVRTP